MMKRRDFLRATLVTAGGLFVPACSGESDSPQTPAPPWTLTPGEAYFPQSIASGDPKPGSVILWTRVIDPDNASDLTLHLEIALDSGFKSTLQLGGQARIQATAEAGFDHCAKVKVAGLAAATTYYYRFIYTKGDTHYVSRTGRTRTAPDEDADVPVRFAFVSCQDYIGRYYNTYHHLADPTAFDLDFFVHLGDYVYETTGDPSFQLPDPNRKVTFADEAGAISLTATAGSTFYAAKSLDNYRDLYRTYRTDQALQAMHERVPMIPIWDDHEFSDDCFGATATYFGGEQNELDVNRRKAANQAWFEYMPVDYAEGDSFRYDSAKAFPGDIRIYRDFAYGKNVHLVLTDLRSYRPDHQIPEDAFPGKVFADEAALTAAFGTLPALAAPYVSIDDYPMHKQALTTGAATLGYDAASVAGNLSVFFVNTVALQVDPMLMPIDPMQPGLLRGFSYVDLGKSGFYSSIGSRYIVVKDVFDVYSSQRYAASNTSQDVMGPEQEAWFLNTITSSKHTWKVWCNEYCLTPLQIDVTTFAVPPQYQRRFYMNVDDWNGFRDKRDELLTALSALSNVVVITGDIHAFYASTPMVEADPTRKIVEFVGSSISTASFRDLLISQVENDPSLAPVKDAAMILASGIDTFLTDTTAKINPHLGYANSTVNGFSVVEATSSDFTVTFYEIASTESATDHSGNAGVAGLFMPKRFRTLAGESELYQEIGGAWKRWDPATFAWV
jgi:alkaline phosphatase D